MRMIAAVDSQWGIGRDGDLLFNIPEDKRWFRERTQGGTVVMGGVTLRSLPGGKPLKGRRNLVLTRHSQERMPEGVEACSSVEAVLREAAALDPSTVWVIGGAQIYEQLAPYCDGAIVTKVDTVSGADRFMPDLDRLEGWRLASETESRRFGDLAYRFCEYENERPRRLGNYEKGAEQ